MKPGLCIFSSFFSHWQATKLIFEIHQDRKIHLSLIKDIRVEAITIKFSYSNKLYNGKRRRGIEVVLWEQTKRIGKKRWRKNAIYKNALFGFSYIASCLKGLYFTTTCNKLCPCQFIFHWFFWSNKPPLQITWISKIEKTKLKYLKINTNLNFSIYKPTSSSNRTTNLIKEISQ